MEMIHNKWFIGFPFSEEWLKTYTGYVKQRYNDYINKEEWINAIFSVERPYRTQELCDLLCKMNPEQQWEAIKEVYIDSEKPSVNVYFWKFVFSLDSLKTFYNKTKEELPSRFKIYRGMSKEEHVSTTKGISWTLSKEKAEFFANRFKRDGVVEERNVDIEDIVCFLPNRNEQEVIYFEN